MMMFWSEGVGGQQVREGFTLGVHRYVPYATGGRGSTLIYLNYQLFYIDYLEWTWVTTHITQVGRDVRIVSLGRKWLSHSPPLVWFHKIYRPDFNVCLSVHVKVTFLCLEPESLSETPIQERRVGSHW